MKLNEIYKSDKTVFSFEVFPPDTDEGIEKLYSEIQILKRYNTRFISLTCNTSGKNTEFSKKVLLNIKNKYNLDVMPHITCINSKKESIDKNLEFIKSNGIENILALRGDKPNDDTNISCEFSYADELVKYIKLKNDFSVAAAGYPEGHIESPSINEDINNLKKKIEAGADVVITQMFFDNNKFYGFVDKVQKAGIDVPIIAGIMPIISIKQLQKMTSLAKITIPEKLSEQIEKHNDDKNYIKNLGIEFASQQCRELKESGVKGLHFFTLNKSYPTAKILDNIL